MPSKGAQCPYKNYSNTRLHKNSEYSTYSRETHLPAVALIVQPVCWDRSSTQAQPWCSYLAIGKDSKVHRLRHSTWLFLNAFYLVVHIHTPFASSFSQTADSTSADLCSSTVWQQQRAGCLSESECTDWTASKRFTESSVQMISFFTLGEKQHKRSCTNSQT